MGFMGYDPHGVDVLRQAMREVSAALDLIRADDVAARDAVGVVRLVNDSLVERWLLLLDGVRSCRALVGYVPTPLPVHELELSLLAHLHETAGWKVTTDPMIPPATLHVSTFTASHARAIAWQLSSSTDVEELLDPQEVAWLAGALRQIADDPERSSAFMAAMTPAAWQATVRGLARVQMARRGSLVAPPGDETGGAHSRHLDASLDALSTMAATDIEVLDRLTPLSAAILVERLDDAARQAELAKELVRRWAADPERQWPAGRPDDLSACGGGDDEELCARYLALDGNVAQSVFSGFSASEISALRDHVDADRLPTRGLDWSTDSCSTVPGALINAGLGGAFSNACGRHDFAYRNNEAIFGRVHEDDRSAVDHEFRQDLHSACSRFGIPFLGPFDVCIGAGEVVNGGVRIGGESAYR